ncbi:MAG: DUF2752 domain-containing protein [Lentisphaerae bacterium]|nr:DUF2752 domain-containing protein [Lentisphaerota bacterium]MCP4101838.1 DUF2752 domain-containing protein [Lentisphaerota bacterium]
MLFYEKQTENLSTENIVSYWLEITFWLMCAIVGIVYSNAASVPLLGDMQCWLHSVTALPCFTCGMTAAWLNFWHFKWLEAAHYNLMVFIAAGFVLYRLYIVICSLAGKKKIRLKHPYYTLIVLATVWFLYGTIRMLVTGLS